MDGMMKHLTRSRGAAAALLFTSIAPVVGAQGTEPARARSHDSVLVRVFGLPEVRLDSLKVMIRELEREPYGSADWLTISRRVDSLVHARKPNIVLRGMLQPSFGSATLPAIPPSGWLGFVTQGLSEHIVDGTGQHVVYFGYPTIISVDPNSPAEKAGILRGDVLLAYNGRDIVNNDFNLTRLLRPDTKVTITVRRGDEIKEFSATVARGPEQIARRRRELESNLTSGALRIERLAPDAPDEPPQLEVPRAGPRRENALRAGRSVVISRDANSVAPMLVLSMNGMFGANMSTVSAELAKALSLKTGVLVTDVPEETPAWRAGLRSGDVIVRVDDEPVLTLSEFRNRVLTRLQQRAVALQVVRNQKPRTVTLTWSSP
jgi:membrane-associated protease RseP (regulator of RpoE activity)